MGKYGSQFIVLWWTTLYLTTIELVEYVLNKCITQAGEDQPVKYNFDILEDQVPHKHYDHYTLVCMVSNQNRGSVWKVHRLYCKELVRWIDLLVTAARNLFSGYM